MVKPVPDGYHTVTPYLAVRGAGELLAFLKRAFDAEAVECIEMDGAVHHAEVRIGDSMVMLGECPEDADPQPAVLYLYVDDADARFQRAGEAGAEVIMEPVDQFYGDRQGAVKDPCGNSWYIATHIEDVSAEEIARRKAAMGEEDHG